MKTSRREFIRNSVLIGCGAVISEPSFAEAAWSGKRKSVPDIGVCTGIENSTLLQYAGYAYVEEGVQHFLVPAQDDAVFLSNLELAKKSLLPVRTCNSFLPGSMKSVGPNAVHDQILRFAEMAFQRAALSGVKIIVFGSGASRSIPDGFTRDEAKKQFVSLCKQMAPLAGKYNVVVVLEPLNSKECNFINSVTEGGEIVTMIAHPNFQLLADLYHMKMEDEGPSSIIQCGHLLRHVHIAEKEGRAAPGTHGENFTPYFNALKKIKYKGAISVECKWQSLESQAPVAIQTIKEQWKS